MMREPNKPYACPRCRTALRPHSARIRETGQLIDVYYCYVCQSDWWPLKNCDHWLELSPVWPYDTTSNTSSEAHDAS